VVVWCLFALQAAATLFAYSRLPPDVLYNVDEAGDLAGGLGRTLVVVNYPLALGVIALAAVAGGPRLLVWVAIALCALTAVPGVVDQEDLDARWINVLPAAGVAIALGLTVVAARRGLAFTERARGDRLRLALAAGLLLLALPWMAADIGYFFPGDFFMGEERSATRDPQFAAVHLGFHHGIGGVLLALTALALSRLASRGRALAAYLALMLAYGLANAVEDGWNEQLWKRGTLDTKLPSVLRPELSWGWLAIVAAAAAVYVLWFRPRRQT
jgi:hypothetical protein